MVAGGIVAAFLGVKAEGQSLESIARPLTAEDDDPAPGTRRPHPPAGPSHEPRGARHAHATTEGRRPRDAATARCSTRWARSSEPSRPPVRRRPTSSPGCVGAAYWEQGRFDRALALAVSDGLVFRTADGTISASG